MDCWNTLGKNKASWKQKLYPPKYTTNAGIPAWIGISALVGLILLLINYGCVLINPRNDIGLLIVLLIGICSLITSLWLLSLICRSERIGLSYIRFVLVILRYLAYVMFILSCFAIMMSFSLLLCKHSHFSRAEWYIALVLGALFIFDVLFGSSRLKRFLLGEPKSPLVKWIWKHIR